MNKLKKYHGKFKEKKKKGNYQNKKVSKIRKKSKILKSNVELFRKS